MKKKFLLLLFVVSATMYATNKTVSIQIKQASDDMEELLDPSLLGETDYASSDLELGYENTDGTHKQLIGLRFADVPVKKDRVIKSAYIQFELDATSKTLDPFNMHIWAEDADSTATYNSIESDPYSLSSRIKLVDSIAWSIPAGEFNTVDVTYNTVDIAPLLQQLINRSAWKEGNAVSFYIKGEGIREVESYDGEASAAAKLFIEYVMSDEDIADSIASAEEALLSGRVDSVVSEFAGRVVESDYTIPSWTLYKRAEVEYLSNQVLADSLILIDAHNALVSKEMPYTVSMAINGNPSSQLGFTWYTNLGVDKGEVQIVAGKVATSIAFEAASVLSYSADTLNIYALNYCNSKNNLSVLAGIENNAKREYSSHKALVTGLSPNTTYSYRVGKSGSWSEIGTFTTAKSTKDEFSFFYLADTQAMNDDYFSVSQKTVLAAKAMVPDAQFCLMTGDLVESSGSSNSEWEWEQWFELMQPVWKDTPIAPVCGNHDKSVNKNLTNHFNTASVGFDQDMSTTPGAVYSFVYGDALFIACSTEDYGVAGYLDSLSNYIRREVAAHPEVKWKIAFYHKTVYTGSQSHQSDSDGKSVRDALVPVFDEVGIDMAFQGHDHIYEVIGVTNNFGLVDGSVSGVETVSAGGDRENMTGKQGGIYNVKNGTLFFLNNSAGKKKYEPRTEAQMDEAFSETGITNYWGMFTGKFGQTGEPTFSDVRVSSDTIFVDTYTVDEVGVPTLYDSFKVVKSTSTTTGVKESQQLVNVRVFPNPSNSVVNIEGVAADIIAIYNTNGQLVKSIKNKNQINVSGLIDGVYMIKVLAGDKMFVDQLVVK